jgi:hypothetical protein
MSESPIEQLLAAVDSLDADAAMRLAAPGVRFLLLDGRRVEGKDETRTLLADFLASLRSTSHRIASQWHVDDVWIAEVEADYVLQDWLELTSLARAMVVRVGPDGIRDIRVYGANEQPLSDHPTGEEGTWVGERWMPPL